MKYKDIVKNRSCLICGCDDSLQGITIMNNYICNDCIEGITFLNVRDEKYEEVKNKLKGILR